MERFGQICTHDAPDEMGKTFSEIKMWLEQLCSLSKRCDYPEHKKIMKFLDHAEKRQRSILLEQDKPRVPEDVRDN